MLRTTIFRSTKAKNRKTTKRQPSTRRLTLEGLERRELLAGVPFAELDSPSVLLAETAADTANAAMVAQESTNRMDVNGDGNVTAADVLAAINYLNYHGSRSLAEAEANAPTVNSFDTTGDGIVSAQDVLLLINFINGGMQTAGSTPLDLDLGEDALELPPEVVAEFQAMQLLELPEGEADAALAASSVPYGAAYNDNSEYMLGDVWVTVVLLESNGATDRNTENWTSTEINRVKSEIREGLDWWEDTLAAQFPNAKNSLDFQVDWTYADSPVPTEYEPINHRSDEDYLWIGSFSDYVDHNNQYRQYRQYSRNYDLDTWNDLQRVQHNTDWAFTVFVVDSSADVDGKFSNAKFAYAYLGGPYTVMTYDNNGWGIDRMSMVLAHETGHIFHALDEYAASNETYTDRSGYYNTQNLNAELGHPNPSSRVDSLMAESARQIAAYNAHTSSPSSLEMVGWKDSDGDGVFDVLDVPMTLTGNGSYNAATGRFEFTGQSKVETLPNLNPQSASTKHAITLNAIDLLQHRLDGGAWIDGNRYSGHSATVSQSVPVAAGRHTIEFRTVCQENGVTSNVWSRSLDVPTTPPSFVLQSGSLAIQGSITNETITVTQQGNNIVIGGSWNGSAISKTFPASQVQKIAFYGQAGADEFRNQTSIPSYADGGDGDDKLYGGSAADELIGGNGNDRLEGGNGNDHMEGGPGSDSMLGGYGNDCMRGGDDRDFMNGTDGDDEMYGDGGDDWMAGQAGNDVMYGGAGNDDLHGHGGDDRLFGDDGNDRLNGYEGDDRLEGGNGNDNMEGGPGSDSMLGGYGNDYMRGGDDRDFMNGTDGDDEMYGDGGDDWMAGQAGKDVMYGGAGNDDLHGHGGDDRLFGGDGNDRLNGYEGDDRLEGGNGNDNMEGGPGTDSMLGGYGNDYMRGGDDRDFMNGERGNDVIYGDAGNDWLAGQEEDDTIYGGPGNDHLLGHDGQDKLYGEDGDDRLEGGAGLDLLDGGSGNDTPIQ